jgi:hypothetical protein
MRVTAVARCPEVLECHAGVAALEVAWRVRARQRGRRRGFGATADQRATPGHGAAHDPAKAIMARE